MGKFSDILKESKQEDDAYDSRPELQGVVNKKSFDFISTINENTGKLLGKQWADNVKDNKRFWKKHSPVGSCLGLGKNKCVIGIGASPSFHKNKDVLKRCVNLDGTKSWEERDFITIAANHQYKPLLEMGIQPDFVILVDGSDVVFDQLCRDIPPSGQNTTLITGVHASPKVVRAWTKQGRHIVFYTTGSDDLKKAFRKHINRDPDKHKMDLGGNVLNGAFMMGTMILRSTVFMGVGNDLSFEIGDTIDDQRNGYYADGDYSSNAKLTGTGRDEAASHKRWAGFSLEKRKIYLLNETVGSHKRYNMKLDLVGTSKTLWVYKTWLETTMMSQVNTPAFLNYFNCTEGGILGVMAKNDDDASLKSLDNWFMLDEVCMNQHTGKAMYHTAMLEDAIEIFLEAKRKMSWQTKPIVPPHQLVQSVGGRASQA